VKYKYYINVTNLFSGLCIILHNKHFASDQQNPKAEDLLEREGSEHDKSESLLFVIEKSVIYMCIYILFLLCKRTKRVSSHCDRVTKYSAARYTRSSASEK